MKPKPERMAIAGKVGGDVEARKQEIRDEYQLERARLKNLEKRRFGSSRVSNDLRDPQMEAIRGGMEARSRAGREGIGLDPQEREEVQRHDHGYADWLAKQSYGTLEEARDGADPDGGKS